MLRLQKYMVMLLMRYALTVKRNLSLNPFIKHSKKIKSPPPVRIAKVL